MTAVRVELPAHLRTLARISGHEVRLEIAGEVTQRALLDALEQQYPMLRGTIREHGTLRRRAFLRFFACEEDLSFELPDSLLPEAVAAGKEPFLIVGAVAGGSPGALFVRAHLQPEAREFALLQAVVDEKADADGQRNDSGRGHHQHVVFGDDPG